MYFRKQLQQQNQFHKFILMLIMTISRWIIDFLLVSIIFGLGLTLWCLTPISSIFQKLSFIDGGTGESHRSVASDWQTLSHNVVSSTPCHERESNSQRYWWYVLIVQVVVFTTTIRSRPRQTLRYIYNVGLLLTQRIQNNM
jgi:hypothetical protein